jgi:hypothetical protein
MADAFKITIQPCDKNHVASGDGCKKVGSNLITPQDSATPTVTVVIASNVQIRGIMGYIAACNAGVSTTGIETAVGSALT